LFYRPKRVFELYIGDPYKPEQDSDLFESSDEEEEEEFIPASPVNHSTPANQNQYNIDDSSHIQGLTIEKESLRLSLPTADDDYDEADDMDTER